MQHRKQRFNVIRARRDGAGHEPVYVASSSANTRLRPEGYHQALYPDHGRLRDRRHRGHLRKRGRPARARGSVRQGAIRRGLLAGRLRLLHQEQLPAGCQPEQAALLPVQEELRGARHGRVGQDTGLVQGPPGGFYRTYGRRNTIKRYFSAVKDRFNSRRSGPRCWRCNDTRSPPCPSAGISFCLIGNKRVPPPRRRTGRLRTAIRIREMAPRLRPETVWPAVI